MVSSDDFRTPYHNRVPYHNSVPFLVRKCPIDLRPQSQANKRPERSGHKVAEDEAEEEGERGAVEFGARLSDCLPAHRGADGLAPGALLGAGVGPAGHVVCRLACVLAVELHGVGRAGVQP